MTQPQTYNEPTDAMDVHAWVAGRLAWERFLGHESEPVTPQTPPPGATVIPLRRRSSRLAGQLAA